MNPIISAPSHDPSRLAVEVTALWMRPRAVALRDSRWESLPLTESPEEALTTQDALKQQFEMFYQTTRLNLEDMTHAQSLVDPEPAGNRANWILGHVINVQNGVMHLLGAEPVWQSEDLSRITPDPGTLDSTGLDWEEMKSRLFASESRCLKALGSLDDARLTEQVDDPFGGRVGRGVLLGILAFHQSYHAGQFGTARRLVGLPGAIRGPGQ